MHAPSNRSHSLDLALWLQIMDGVVELNELLRESLVGPYGPPRPRKDLIWVYAPIPQSGAPNCPFACWSNPADSHHWLHKAFATHLISVKVGWFDLIRGNVSSNPCSLSPDGVDGLLYRHLLASDQVGEHEGGRAAGEDRKIITLGGDTVRTHS